MMSTTQLKMGLNFITLFFIATQVSCNLEVETNKGFLKGKIVKSRDGHTFYSFTGIPYAKPPVGDLRFKAPEPFDSWNGTLDATKTGNMCIQRNYYFKTHKDLLQGEEDCLNLNVYTKNLNGNLPVMVWIHGGGFAAGHSGPDLYGPEYFMDKEIVFVSLNYRLGILGFLSFEDDVMPGNYGMKDQVMALRWVQENIARFGGDPNQVTIFGESAGGASTGYHMISPMSKGLFHKAILQSGAPLCRWAVSVPGLPRKRAEAVATIAGCFVHNSKEILKCLRTIPAKTMADIYYKFFEWNIHPSVLFSPVVESCNSDEEAFLCRHPLVNFKQESHVPVIIGLNSGEGGLYIASLYNSTSPLYPELRTDFKNIMPNLLFYKHFAKPEHFDEISNLMLKEYFPTGQVDDHTHSNAVDLIGEGVFTTCIIDTALKFSSPVYLYLFDYENEISLNKFYGSCEKSLGVSHGDEMISLFKMNVLLPQGLNNKDTEVSKMMVDIWTKFAISEYPTIDGKENGLAWPQFESFEESSILHLNSPQPNIKLNPFKEKYNFWNKLPLLSHLNEIVSKKSSEFSQNLKSEL
ncbi:juvenile hormone esterase-like [Daktulosphaira vitifoliae]|uniref:juvenile hormone esterase-like n=1 Tax=Daktulosphaira vitifoliae TaxID=58002 RepID=UPI0021A9F7DC|nr:juvenile hormone esterase-like [Daktulosphaira vitifoliae]